MKNASDYDYLFPDRKLRERAEKQRKNYSFQLLSSALISSFMAIGTVCVLCTGWVLEINLMGYAYPIFLGMAFFLTFLASLQTFHYLSKTEKEQRKRLVGRKECEKIIELYSRYDEYYRFKGKILPFMMIVSLLVSLAIAVPLPDKPWSAIAIVFLVIGAILNNKYYAAFRESIAPLQKEIDEERMIRLDPDGNNDITF